MYDYYDIDTCLICLDDSSTFAQESSDKENIDKKLKFVNK